MKIPSRIYKYQPFNVYAIKNLKNNQLYFNDPNNFNDPYDTNHNVEIEDFDDESLIHIYFEKNSNERFKELFQNIRIKNIDESELISLLTNIKKDFPGIELLISKGLDCKPEELIQFVNIKMHNEHGFHLKLYKILAVALKRSIRQLMANSLTILRNGENFLRGVCCFSDKVDDLLMWSYYAEGHKGFCLEFDTNSEPFNKIHPVDYVTEIPKINPNDFFTDYDAQRLQLIKPLLLSKFKKWEHEGEWRALHKQCNFLYQYPPASLTGIYFGSKMDKTSIEIISLIVQNQVSNVKFYKMSKVEGDFKLDSEQVNYTSLKDLKFQILNILKSKFLSKKFSLNEFIKKNTTIIPNEKVDQFLNLLVDDNLLLKDGDDYYFEINPK